MKNESYTLRENSTVTEDRKSIEGQYQKMSAERETYIERARESAELTIPYLYPPEGNSSATDYITPYQSIGSRGVTNLASKLMLALFPPQAPFFRIDVDELVYKSVEGSPEQKQGVQEGLSKVEKAVMDNIESSSDRVAIHEALKHLIVSGNCLLHLTDDGLRTYRLNNYVIKRDPRGNVLKIIIKESISINALPQNIVEQLEDVDIDDDKILDLYTCVIREGEKYYVHQEVKKKIILTKEYKLDKLPYIALRFNRIDGMSYGRGHVEQYIGDLKAVEGLTRAILEGSSASAKMLFMVAPNGSTQAKSISSAPNGAIISGSASDVTVLQAGKFSDFRVAKETIDRTEQRLQYAFLLNASVQRNAERVTATEVQLVANELQDALGGVYSILTTEFQLPYVNAKIAMLREKKLLPNLPKELVKIKIIVGMEALGRASDRLRLLQFMSDLGNTLGAEVLSRYINLDNAIKKFAIANSIDMEGLLKTTEEIQQEEAQAQQQQMAQQVTNMATDPRVAIEAGKSLANSGAEIGMDGGDLTINQPEQE